MSKHNIEKTVSNQMCLGCGICEDVCPKQCITIRQVDGEHRPIVATSNCIGDKCGRCLKVCPGIGLELDDMGKTLFMDDSVKEDKYIGRYVALHTGYSTDESIRYHAASGGMVSQFLIYLLDKGVINGAVVTGFGEDHITPISYIARTREDIIAARSSKYCPVALNKIGNEIASSEGRYVIVGLPCHIQGFRKRAKIDKQFRTKVIGNFAIYCSSNRTFGARDYIFQRYHVNKQNISYFAFRDNGCLGSLTIKHGEPIGKIEELKIPYLQYYGELRSFFKPHRCLTCIDHYGELADVCFGDIHIQPYSEDRIGISSWIVRSLFWEDLFRKATKEGFIKMDDLNAETLNHSQAAMLYPKQRRVKAAMNIDKLLGRLNPIYDKEVESPRMMDYVQEIVCHIQRYIGHRPYLWFLIKLLDKNK